MEKRSFSTSFVRRSMVRWLLLLSFFFVSVTVFGQAPAPTGVFVTSLTQTTAVLSWGCEPSSNRVEGDLHYDYVISTNQLSTTLTTTQFDALVEGNDGVIAVGRAIGLVTSQLSIDGLSSETMYYMLIRQNAEDVSDGVSEWSTLIEFKTLQMPIPLPYECDFETGASWNLINGSSENAWVIGSAVSNGGGSKALYISSDGGTSNTYNNLAETNVWATRLLEVTEEGDYLFSFDWKGKGESSYDYLAAVLVPASVTLEAGSDAGLSLGLSVSIPDGWISLSGTTRLNQSDAWQTCVSEQHLLPGQYNLAFYWKNDASAGSDPAAAVDNISITKILCPRPQLPTLSGLTANGATLVFSDDRTYNVKVFATPSTDPATDESAVFTQENVSTSCSVSGLTVNTVYYAYVQAICNEGNSEWVGPVQVKTLCLSLTGADLPYENGFEEDAPNFPECWTLVYSDYDGYPRVVTGTDYGPAYDGSSSLYSTYYTSGGWYDDSESFNAMVALPGLSEDIDLTTLSLRFYMKGSGADIVVGVMTDPGNKETFTEVERISGSSSYKEYFVHFTSFTGEGKYIALKYDSVFATVYIDQISIMPTPTCFKPTSFSVKDVMSTEATVEVVDVDHTNVVDVEYGLSGFVQGSRTTVQIPVGDSIITLTGLVPQTAYDVYVRNHCSDEDISEWLPKQTFVTMCAADVVTADSPFMEDFESYSLGNVDQDLAGCWIQSSTSSETWKVSDGESGYSYSLSPIGTYSAALAWSANAWMYRSVHLEPGNYQLSCYAVQDVTDGCTLSLGFGETFSTIAKIHTQPITNGDYQLVRGEFAVASAGDYVIGIHGELTSRPYYVMVDNIRLAMVNCLTPGTPVVSEITDVSAKVSWGDTGASTYNLKVFTAKPDDVETATGIYANNGIVPAEGQLVEPLSGLTPLTTYYVYVQSVCGDGSMSEWSNVKEFTTECSAIALSEENPYVDGFEEDSQLDCWNLTVQERGDVGTTTSIKHSGSTAIYAYKTNAVSPQFGFAEGDNMSNYQLSGFAYASTDALSFTVSVMKNLDREGKMYVRDVTLNNKQEWTEFIISLAALGEAPDVADYKYIELNFTEEDRIYIDDLRFEVIPTCPKPADISISEIGETSATMDWVSNGSETQWRVIVKEAGVAGILKNELVSEHPYQLTGLTNNTVYEVSLRAVCEEGVDESTDVMATFKTSCGVMALPFNENFNTLTSGIPDCWNNEEGTTTNDSHKWNYDSYGYEGGCLKFNSYNNADGNTNYLKSPAITLTSDARLKFMYKKQSSTGTLAVYLSVDGAPYTDVVLSTDLYSSSWSEAVYDLSAYTGSEIAVVFEGISDYGSYNIFVDNVLVEEIPSCERPQSVTVAKTTNEATITVTDEGHSAWEYAYGFPGFDVTEAVSVAMSSNTATISGLEAETDYEVYVRAVCAEDDKSAWYGPVSFKTGCLPIAIPLEENFDDWDAISSCWTNEHTAGSNTTLWSVSTTNAYSGKAVYLNYQSTGNVVVLSTPALIAEAGKEYRVSFYMHHHSGNSYAEEHLNVYKGTTPLPALSSTLLGTRYLYYGGNEGLNSAGMYKHEFRWTQTTTENIYINFELVWQNGYATAIDEVVVEEVPTCERPVSVKTSNVTATSVDVVITDPYGSAWEAVTGVKGFNPNDETVAVTPLSSTVGTISGSFEPDVEMDLYVRTDCGTEDGKSRWYGPVVFKFVDWSVIAGEGVGIITDGDYPWEIINDAGTDKAQSTNVGVDNSFSDLTSTFTLAEGERGTLSFDYYVSSEGSSTLWDYLILFVNPEDSFTNSDYYTSFGKKGGESGESGSYSIEFNEAGTHTVIWRYSKDYSDDGGDDLAQVWNITLTKNNIGVSMPINEYGALKIQPNLIERGGKVYISSEFTSADRNNLRIEVYNSIGQCVAIHTPVSEAIYVEDFHVSGMYLVKVTTGTGKLYVGHVIVK